MSVFYSCEPPEYCGGNPPSVPKRPNPSGFYYERFRRDGSVTFISGHYHNLHEVYFLLKGNCRYFIEGKFFDMQEGDIALIPKEIPHKVIYSGESTDRHLINFSDRYIDEIFRTKLKPLFEGGFYRPKKEHISVIANLFDRIAAEWKHQDDFSELTFKNFTTELFLLMLRNPSEATPGTEIDIPIEKTTQYIIANYKEDLTLNQMAKMAALSPSYYSRRFKSLTGFGFKEYLTIIRVKEAEDRLIHSDKSIVKIAYECGFNDSNYFSTVFKDFNGISPLKYRKQHRVKLRKRS